MHSPSRTIAIIGGGFSGTVLAANLLRHPPEGATRIVLFERQHSCGWGVAYRPSAFPYLLNVPAGRMSAVSAEPMQFAAFAAQRVPGASADSYLPRALYGEYLQQLLDRAAATAPPGVHLERVHSEVTDIVPVRVGGPLLLHFGERRQEAEQVVLACGDPPAAHKSYAAEVAASQRFTCDPHGDECIRAADRTVLLIGTGLTMVDVAVAAATKHPQVRLIAVSRHGLLPTPQNTTHSPALQPDPDLRARLGTQTLRQVVHSVRVLAQTARDQGGDWRELIARVREVVPALWQKLSHDERRQFLRHVRVYWDIHRHRMPPAMATGIAALQHSGQLQVRAGSVTRLQAHADRIIARWRPRGHIDTQELVVDRVIDCSGADHRLAKSTHPLLRQLLDRGLMLADAAGLGLHTGPHGAMLDAAGRPAARLYYLGPMLRADHWEATAVAELRVRAEQLAQVLVRQDIQHVSAPQARTA